MKRTMLPKCSKIPTLVGISSFLLCVFTNASAGSVNHTTNSSFFAILQRIKTCCKQSSSTKSKKNNSLDSPEMYQLQQAETDGCSTISKHQTKDSSSHALLSQAMTQPMDPTVDGGSYINFCACGLSNKMWHRVGLISYLQQANTQINSDSPSIATKRSILPNHSNPLNDVATDELLEELLGVHTFIKPVGPERKKSIWANFSFDCSIGVGVVFYSNCLEQMRLLQRQKQDYFFITKANEIYKPNWFHHTLNKVTDFDPSDRIEDGSSENAVFQGTGLGLPITLGIQYVFWQRLLVGVGREMAFNATNRLVHNDDNIKHKEYIMHKRWSAQGRWFARCGWYVSNNVKRRFFGDIRLFHVQHLGHMFSALVTFGPYLHQAVAYNLGLGSEQQLTDNLSSTIRLAIELQRFKQFSNKQSYDYNIQYQQPAIYLQVGLSMRSTKYDRNIKNKKHPCNTCKLNNVSSLEGLQNFLDLH